jgi:hypothetical protein
MGPRAEASEVLDWEKLWEDLVLLLIGESLPDAEQVNGAYIMDKTKGKSVAYRLEIWANTMPSPALQRELKDRLTIAQRFQIKL